MTQCCIALGANLGDPAKQFELALTALNKAGHRVLRSSRNYITPAMGSEAGCDFHNAAAVIDTPLPPEEFLQQLHDIEASLGRRRTIAWGPRSLDLDLLFYRNTVVQASNLVVPHPLLWLRRFVLDPLNEVAKDWMHPTLGETVGELLQRLNVQPLEIEIQGADATIIAAVYEALRNHFAVDSFELTSQPTNRQFAVIATGDSRPLAHPTQPNIESARILRRPADCVLESFLRDVLTAALPPDQLLTD